MYKAASEGQISVSSNCRTEVCKCKQQPERIKISASSNGRTKISVSSICRLYDMCAQYYGPITVYNVLHLFTRKNVFVETLPYHENVETVIVL